MRATAGTAFPGGLTGTPPTAPTSSPNTNAHECLAEPLPGNDSRSLDQVLREREQQLWARQPTDPGTAIVSAAVKATLALERQGQPCAVDADVMREACELLLAFDQARLLGRLAKHNPSLHTVLNVGADIRRAATVARLADHWPSQACASIVLDTALPVHALQALQPFLARPASLSLTLDDHLAGGLADPHTAQVWSAVVQRWPLTELSLAALPASTPLSQALAGRHVGRLALAASAVRDGADIAELLAWAEKNGAHTIVFKGGIDICDMAEGLEAHLLKSTYVFEKIEACFVARQDNPLIEDAFHSLLHSPMVVCLHHRQPGDDVPRPPTRKPDIEPISSEAQAALNASSALNRLLPPEDRVDRVRREVEKRWAGAASVLGGLLADDASILDLYEYLKAPDNALIRALPAEATRPSNRDLQSKLSLVHRSGQDERLLKAAVTQCVRDHPGMGPSMCWALARLRLLVPARSPTEWEALRTRYATTWLRESMAADIVDLVSPPRHADPNDPNHRPAPSGAAPGAEPPLQVGKPVTLKAQAVQDLVEPRTEQGVALLGHAVRNALLDAWVVGQIGRGNGHVGRPAALQLILIMLNTGAFEPAALEHRATSSELAAFLLAQGQGRLLRHIVVSSPPELDWDLPVDDAAMAKALEAMSPWPQDRRTTCTLRVSNTLSPEAGADVAAFAATVSGEQLGLSISLAPFADTSALCDILGAHHGMGLQLNAASHQRLDVDATLDLLLVISNTARPRSIYLHGLNSTDERLSQALVNMVQRCKVADLVVGNCHPALIQPLVSIRHWNTLFVQPTAELAAHMAEGGVSARHLLMAMGGRSEPDDQAHVETMLAHCQGLVEVTCRGGPVDVLKLARGLDRNRSVGSFAASLAATSDADAREALKILRRNTGLLHVEPGPPTRSVVALKALDARFIDQVVQGVTHNLLLHPTLSTIGVGRGFGLSWRWGGHYLIDVGERVGRLLAWDTDALQALSLVNKATSVGSRISWEIEIDRLAKLFALTDAHVFNEQLVRQLRLLDDLHRGLSGETPQLPNDHDLLDKVLAMEGAGISRYAIGKALGRALGDRRVEVVECLAAMVCVDAMPVQEWLMAGMGIEL